MPYSLSWLPKVLRDAGLRVAETNGWLDRGRGDVGDIRGVMCHHTGSGGTANMPTLNMLINGRGGDHPLSGPLAQLGLARDGAYYVIAAGRANHAGAGNWRGIDTGNRSFIGIEAENAGTSSDRWPDWQLDAYQRGVAAILKYLGTSAEMCCGHKEYALPKGRKPDPLFDMDEFRMKVRGIMAGTVATRPIVPASDGASGRLTLERGAQGDDVLIVQSALGVTTDGKFGAATEAALRQYQLNHGLRSDGVVGPRTWSKLLENENQGSASIGHTRSLIPEPGRKILDLIASVEAPAGYGTIYGNNQSKLDKALTAMTLDEVVAAGPSWSAQFGSSACGRYQFMNATLKELRVSEKLGGAELFSESVQDRLGYALLEKRGYERFITGKIALAEFGKALAQEWAAFPVLENCQGQHRPIERGETYYAGDKRNNALLTPEKVEELLISLSGTGV